MIQVYTGNVYAVQEGEFGRDDFLQFFLSGHREEYISVYREKKLLKIISYFDVLFDREVPEGVLLLSESVFEEARAIFFSFENRLNRALAVCNEAGEVECIFTYQKNVTNFGYPVDEFKEYDRNCSRNLDLTLLRRADAFVISNLEEYTDTISKIILREMPEKKIIFLDENAGMFFDRSNRVTICKREDVEQKWIENASKEKIMYVSSDQKRDYGRNQQYTMQYNSLDIMTSLFWKTQGKRLGEKNPTKKFMLIQFPIGASGLGDILLFTMTKLAMLDEQKLDYIPVIDLNVEGDINQFSAGRTENVWEYYFEPISGYAPGQVENSANVLVMNHKIDAFHPLIMEQYYQKEHMQAAFKKYLKLNDIMQQYLRDMRKKVFQKPAKQILGVVARGTDYKSGKYGLPEVMEDEDYISLVIQKTKEWNCSHILLATEDQTILEKFQKSEIGSKIFLVPQKRYQYDRQKDGLLADLKKKGHDYRDEMPYLATLYLLSECTALISNCWCGAFEIAGFLNADKYEHCECCGKEK